MGLKLRIVSSNADKAFTSLLDVNNLLACSSIRAVSLIALIERALIVSASSEAIML